jgi:nucleoid-associated protein EbfC
MFENLKNFGALLTQAGQIRQKISELREELGHKTVEGEAGAGAVRVTMNGRLEVVSVRLDPVMIKSLLAPGSASGAEDAVTSAGGTSGGGAEQAMVEELLASAVNAASAKAREVVQQEISRLTGGLPIPGLDQLMG